MAVTVYNRALLDLASGVLNWAGDDIRVLLVDATYVPNPDSSFVSAVSGEIVAGNYARRPLTGRTVTRDDANDRIVLDAADTTFPALGLSSPARAVLFKLGPNDGTSPLIACVDLIAPLVANGADYTVAWSASGILRLQQG